MQQRYLLVAEKRVRHSAQSGARRNGAIETDAVRDRAGRAKSDKARAALFTAGDGLGALDRQPLQRQPHDPGARSVANGEGRADKSARCSIDLDSWLRRLARASPTGHGAFQADGRRELQLPPEEHLSAAD